MPQSQELLRNPSFSIAFMSVSIWIASLFFPAFGLSLPGSVKWYPGWTMFGGGLIGQLSLPSLLLHPRGWVDAAPEYFGWWANLAFLAAVIKLPQRAQRYSFILILPACLAMLTLGIKTFGLPDDDQMPVVAYGVGYWLWLLAMGGPLLAIVARHRE